MVCRCECEYKITNGVTHGPLVPWPMAVAIGQGTSWFRRFCVCGWYDWKRLEMDWYGGIRW